MEPYFYLVIALLVLAVLDLVVGVSNDAVNFLNSAIGSKVASRRTIITIAALGVFIGAAFSSGMMEIARKGIFNPVHFSYEDVMVIFMAVMITDILILDLFNSLGLPTSTTVSIVFELLGASVVTGLLMIANTDSKAALSIFEVINHEKATQIIIGIFLSVGIAFTVGASVQWISRLLFTFHIKDRIKKYGPPFAGMAISVITYFLLVKGLKGAAFVPEKFANQVANNGAFIIGITFVAATILTFILQRLAKINPLKIVVLLGTFSLAMAFAGNDLVNFIGVPITGFQSYGLWIESGLEASQFQMSALSDAVKTPGPMLYLAGLIMVLTLWFSSKAKKVTDTELKLSSQHEVDQRFKPNFISHAIVKASTKIGNAVQKMISRKTNVYINRRFRLVPLVVEIDKPAFDLVRASVNLMVASVLIAFASSLKLPLSTTYVSFMVAMGSSLADRAWGSGSAPQRVAGVLNIIGGWFLTAAGAFTAAGLMALLIYYGGPWVAMGLFVIALLVLVRSNLPRALNKKV